LTANVQVITFGCRLNSYESEAIGNMLREVVDAPSFDGRDIIIFNGCAVTTEAERQLRQSIRRIRRERGANPIVGVVGCAAQVNGNAYADMPEVDFIVGNSGKFDVNNYLNFRERPVVVEDISSQRNFNSLRPLRGFENRSRAFVQVQDGCDNNCTFCITRFARGKSVSLPAEKILDQIKRFIDSNYREIVLTGVNICDYGKNLEANLTLGGLVVRILRETTVERLRLSSLDIAGMDRQLVDSIKYEKRLMPHVHLSLQSGNDVILRRMLRRHSREEVCERCSDILEVRRELVIGADFIAGFPTETEDMHRDSITMIDSLPVTYGHIFPFYERPGTKATLMPQLHRKLRKKRAKELREHAAANLKKLRESLKGTTQKVLIETGNLGRLENYLQINLSGNYGDKIGSIVDLIL
jgi:threonylcarbamoyladenosine tRNA methylthiotransferase MtaB